MFFYEGHELLSFIFIVKYCKGPEEEYMQPLNLPLGEERQCRACVGFVTQGLAGGAVLWWPSVWEPLLQLLLYQG